MVAVAPRVRVGFGTETRSKSVKLRRLQRSLRGDFGFAENLFEFVQEPVDAEADATAPADEESDEPQA